jgi:hypothetical protein
MANDDLQPGLDEVLQAEEPTHEPPVTVVVAGPVRVQTLPQKSGSTKTVALAAAGATVFPIRVLQADHRRARATILAIGGAMRIAFNSASKETPATMALWPANVAYAHLGDDEIWVAADTTAITVSVLVGKWAVGEDGGS